jgi:hypothetical protein
VKSQPSQPVLAPGKRLPQDDVFGKLGKKVSIRDVPPESNFNLERIEFDADTLNKISMGAARGVAGSHFLFIQEV